MERVNTVYHDCAAQDCRAKIPAQHLMCPPHWRKVPYYLRQIIWANFRRGTLGLEYAKAVEQAKQIVASMPKETKRAPSWREILGPNGLRTKPRRTA